MFTLHPKLATDSEWIHDLTLCQVRLSLNAAFPWIILVPQIPDQVEMIDLNEKDYAQLYQEIRLASDIIKKLFHPTKLNIANLGNVVPQLHIHVIGRYDHDLAWPHPVWNSGITQSYSEDQKISLLSTLACAFKDS